MVNNQAINCFSGKQIPCEIDSVCIHGDNESSLATAKSIKENLLSNGLILKPLNKNSRQVRIGQDWSLQLMVSSTGIGMRMTLNYSYVHLMIHTRVHLLF